MNNIKIIEAANYTEMSEKAAAMIAEHIISKPETVLGLATGSTPLGIYDHLTALYDKGKLDFSRVTSFNLDEYCGLDESHTKSYRYYMQKNLFGRVNIDKSKAHLPDGMALDVEAQCRGYDELIKAHGGIDIQLLGIGHNGHIGFNEPGDVFNTSTWCVTLDEQTIAANARFFESPADVPRRAITMGIKTIMLAKKILLVVSGEEKHEILRKSLCGPVTPKIPASILQLHPDVVVITDIKM